MASASAAPGSRELADQLRLALRGAAPSRVAGISDDAVAWLAMSPGWPQSLAAAGFPDDEGRVTPEAGVRVLASAAEAGMVDVARGESPWNEPWYAMSRQQRALTAAELAERHAGDYFLRALNGATSAMQRALGTARPPPPLARWIDLGEAGSVDEVADVLDFRVDEAIARARGHKQISCPEALRWIEAAEPLAQVLGGNLQVALARSQRRLELFHRQSRDERLLEFYVPRRAQEAAFLDLTRPESPIWALHFIGYGGTGKTMLMRRITTVLARERGLATARIDFDTLNPNYPSRAPGLLLMGFAEELRLTDDAAAAERFRRFDLTIRSVHQRLDSAFRAGRTDAVGGTMALERGYDDAQGEFVAALATIAENKTPVLLLDTCEELAKMRIGEDLPLALTRTLEILGQLHESVPRLRVVLAGRRMVAGAGHGWSLSGSPLPKWDALGLVELRGFDGAEAEDFLERYRQDGRPVPPRLRPTILAKSAASERSILANVEWSPPCAAEPDGARFNPYDIDLFASLAAAETIPSIEQIARGSETFVRERIVGRLSVETRDILVELAILGRFDRMLLEALTGRPGAEFDAIWSDLKEQEWSDIDRDARDGVEVWTMEPHVRERVCRFFRADALVWHAARERLRPLLRAVTVNRKWSELTPSYFVVALEVLSDEPSEAAEWWATIDRRIAQDGAWEWARDVTALLADIEDPARVERSGLRAAILATRAAAMLRFGRETVSELWLAVDAAAERHPVAEGRTVLRYRALAGGLVARAFRPDGLAEAGVPAFEVSLGAVPRFADLPQSARSDAQLQASEVALLESCAEILDRIEWRSPPPASLAQALRARISAFLEAPLAPDLRVRAAVLDARFQALAGVVERFAVALDGAARAEQTEYLDWLAPRDLVARLRLELALLNRWHYHLDTELVPGIAGLDYDRYVALQMMQMADVGIVMRDFAALTAKSVVVSRHPPECIAHAAVPPYFAVALEYRAANGEITGALRQLTEIASDTAAPLDLRQAAERAALRVATRFRLPPAAAAISGVLGQSTRLADAVLIYGLNAFDPARGILPYRGRWREAVDWLKSKGADPQLEPLAAAEASFAAFSLVLDSAEDREQSLVSDATIRQWERRHPREKLESTVLRVRSGVFSRKVYRDLGERRVAETFLEEGSLLALRQPRQGGSALEAAAEYFRLAGDLQGQRIAKIAAALAWARAGDRIQLTSTLADPVLQIEDPDIELGPGWGLRLRFARARGAEFNKPGPLSADAELLKTSELPLDLRGVLAVRDPSAPPKKLSSGRLETVSTILGFLVGLGGLVGLAFAMVKGVQAVVTILGSAVNVLEAYLEAFGIGALVIGLIASFPSAARFYLREVYKLFRVRFVITAEDPVPDPNRPLVEATTRMIFAMEGFRWLPISAPVTAPRSLPPTAAETYAEQSGALIRRSFSNPFGWLLPLFGVPRPIHLAIEPRLAAACWEAILGLRGGTVRNIARNPFLCRRTGLFGTQELRVTAPIVGPARLQLWAVRIIRQPWSGLAQDPLYRLEVRSTADLSAIDRDDILHLVCEVVDGSGGLELWQSHDIESEPVEAERPSGIPPRAIAAGRSGPPRLIVLQGLPLPGAPQRTRSDRRSAALMRRAAAELFEAGVPAVVVVPPVPEKIAAKAVEPVARALQRRRRDGTGALLDAVREAQRVIAAEAGGEPADALELAFDVCLYCVAGLNLQVSRPVNRSEGGPDGPDAVAA